MEDNTILIGKKIVHKGLMQGILANGGKIQVGNIVIEVIAQAGDFRHVQVYQQGIDAKPAKQTWVRTKKGKTIVKEKIVYKEKPKAPIKRMTTQVTKEVITL